MSTGGILKGVSPINGGSKGTQCPHRPHNLGFQWSCPHNLVDSRDISLAVKPKIVDVAGRNMQSGHFVCPSCCQKRKSTAILRSAWWLSSPGKQEKGAKFGAEKVNSGQNICSRGASVGNGNHFEKQAQCSKD